MIKQLCSLILLFFVLQAGFCARTKQKFLEPENLEIFRNAYPDVKFTASYIAEENDYIIQIEAENKKEEFYWADGKFLPKSEYPNRDNYWSLLYDYPNEIPNPESFTEEDIKRIEEFSSPEMRQSSKGTPQFFFDVIYDCKTRGDVEKNLLKTTFLDKNTTIHKKIYKPLKRIEKQITEIAAKNSDVKFFVDNLASADSYAWRQIRDNSRRSFHSMGLAIDVLPKDWRQKNLYWAWRRDIDKNWIKLPLDKRWMPPKEVIEIFENEGFIYGGKWIIWDNMHFEYHPELILFKEKKYKKNNNSRLKLWYNL